MISMMSFLAWFDPQALVSFILEGGVYERRLRLDDELIKLVKVSGINDGVLYYVRWNNEPIVLHAEFDSYPDSNRHQRLWQYNALVSMATGRPVYSVVLYLVPEPSIPEPFFEQRFQNGQVACSFSFHEIKLWELGPEVIKLPQLATLLPLLPLTKNGQNRETVLRMMCEIIRAKKLEVVWFALQVAEWVLTSEEDQQWLQERNRIFNERMRTRSSITPA